MLNNFLLSLVGGFYGVSRLILSIFVKAFIFFGLMLLAFAYFSDRWGEVEIYGRWLAYGVAAMLARAALDAAYRRGVVLLRHRANRIA